MLLIGIIILAIYIIIPIRCFAIIVGTFLVLAFSSISYYVFAFRGNELMPADFLSIRTAINVVEQYDIDITSPMLYAWILWGLLVFFECSIKSSLGKSKTRDRIVSIGMVFAGVLVFIVLSGNLRPLHFIKTGSAENGYLLNFALQLKETLPTKPKGYTLETIEKFESEYKNEEIISSEISPTIIVIMSESFADLSVLGEIKTNKK